MRLTPTTTAAALGAAALSTAFLVPTFASAGQQPSATGGGQVMVGDKGAGDTIAFTARESSKDVIGQVQYVDRSEEGQTVRHGTVHCISVSGETARLGGTWRDNNTQFGLYVQDNGEGAAAEEDIVALAPFNAEQCSDDPPSNQNWALARGNAQVRGGESAE